MTSGGPLPAFELLRPSPWKMLALLAISAGFVWKEETMDLEALTKTADHQMYKEKEKYHRENRYEPG